MANFGPIDAYKFVQEQGQIGQNRRVQGLQGQAFNAPQDQRAGLIGQIAAVNPKAALETESALQTRQDAGLRRLGGFVRFVDQARSTGNIAAVNAALQQGAPFIQEVLGKPGPTEWTPDMEPGWEALKAQIAMAENGAGTSGVQSTYVDDQGNRVAILRDGSTRILGQNDAGANQQTLTIDIGGVPTQVTFDRRTGRYTNATLGGQPQAQAPQPTRFTNAAGEVFDVSQVQDPVVRQQIMQDPTAWGLAPDGARAQIPTQNMAPQQYGQPLVGRTAEAEAGAVANARNAADLAYLPETERIKRESAIAQSAATTAADISAKAQAEAAQNLPRVTQESDNTIRLIDRALSHPGLSIATGIQGRVDPRNYIPGTDAADFQVLLDQIKGGTFLQAFQSLKGGGAITEVEGRKAEQAIARLSTTQSEEAFRESLGELRSIAEQAKIRAQNKVQGAPSQAVQRARNPQTGEVLILVNGQWVPE